MEDFSVAKTDDYFKYLFAYVSTHFQLENEVEETGPPYIYVNPVQYPSVFIFPNLHLFILAFEMVFECWNDCRKEFSSYGLWRIYTNSISSCLSVFWCWLFVINTT